MDEAWAWALYFAIAALIFTGISGVAPAIIDRSPKRGWWSIILAVLPLVIWDLLWVQMSNPPDNVRRIASILIGSIAGGAILFAATEMMKRPANAQSSPAERPTPPSIGQHNQGPGQQFNAPGGQIYVNPPISQLPQQQQTNDDPNKIYQAAIPVGNVYGGRRLPNDSTVYEFVEITNAERFNAEATFKYQGVSLKCIGFKMMSGMTAGRMPDGMIYTQLLAKVVSP